MDEVKNFAKGTLSTGYDDTATSIVLLTGEGARFPIAPFNAVWWNATDHADPADDPDREIVRVTAKSTDTFTITRAQEGTVAVTHETAGKVYRLIAPLTAGLLNDQFVRMTKTGDNVQINSVGSLNLLPGGTSQMEIGVGMLIRLNGSTGLAAIGELDEQNTGVSVTTDDSTGQVSLKGKIGTNQTASATTLGSVSKKLEIFDLNGDSLGFIPIYSSIT